jgi:glycosyltransferase involved in cell wall biosynthesis
VQIHQFVHTLNYGDAISGEALTIRRILRERSISSNIYSIHAHEKVEDCVRTVENFATDLENAKQAGEEVRVILHYSIASPLNQLILQTEGISKIMIYHNLTPDRWYAPYNQRVTQDLRKGRRELPALLKQMDWVLADSEYNAKELTSFGCSDAHVLPLVLDMAKWNMPANSGIASLMRSQGEKNILHVGRFAPNKRIEDIIKAFYFYHHKIEQKSRLWLVGSDVDTEIYSFELRQLVSELRLKEAVNFIGTVSDDELKALYQGADAYLCLSEHEGFCVPLLEAMHFELPVIAFNSCAVPETLADGGLLVAHKNPMDLAELINLAVSDHALRSELISRGHSRVEHFNEANFSANLERLVVAEPLKSGQPFEDRDGRGVAS